jgi:hypothetical protein
MRRAGKRQVAGLRGRHLQAADDPTPVASREMLGLEPDHPMPATATPPCDRAPQRRRDVARIDRPRAPV